ncbi:MAG: hypothetical protein JWM11_6397 [Planctomycetaceae bacterium]|nr:hypothetical protein [Planctomycetaceae bacterium]
MEELSFNELREQYNALRDKNPNCCDVYIPESLSAPRSIDDYKTLSELVKSAWEHARYIGIWLHNGDHQYRLNHSPKPWEDMPFIQHMIGLELILKVLAPAETRGDFDAFDAVATTIPSTHGELLLSARNQYEGICRIYWEFSPKTVDRIGEHPSKFCDQYTFDQSKWDTWCETEYTLTHRKIQAELARVKHTQPAIHPHPEWTVLRTIAEWVKLFEVSETTFKGRRRDNPTCVKYVIGSNGKPNQRSCQLLWTWVLKYIPAYKESSN